MNRIQTKPIRSDFFLRGQFDEITLDDSLGVKSDATFRAVRGEFRNGLSPVQFEEPDSVIPKRSKKSEAVKVSHVKWEDRIGFRHCCLALLVLAGIAAVFLLEPNGLGWHSKIGKPEGNRALNASGPNTLDQGFGSLEVSVSEQKSRMDQQMAEAKAEGPSNSKAALKQDKKSAEDDIPKAWQEPENFEKEGIAGKSYYSLTHRDPTGDFKIPSSRRSAQGF